MNTASLDSTPVIGFPKWVRWGTASLAGLLLLAYGWFQIGVITSPWCMEMRECGMLYTTDLLLSGEHPYDTSVIPENFNYYGHLYNEIVVPLAAVWGNTYQVHRFVTALGLLAAAAMLYLWLRERGADRWLAFTGGVLIYALGLQTYMTVARPDSLGWALFVAAFCLADGESPAPRRLVLSALCGIFSLFLKLYFVGALPLIALHLFIFRSKRTGILYALGAGAGLALAIYLVNLAYPWYFFSTFTVETKSTTSDVNWLIFQCKDFALVHAGILLAVVIGLGAMAGRALARYWIPFNWQSICAPLWPVRFELATSATLGTATVLLGRMGSHNGAFRLYFVQLLSPPLVVLALLMVRQLHGRWLRYLGLAAVVANVAYLFWILPLRPSQDKTVPALVEGLFSHYYPVLPSFDTAHLAVATGQPVYFDGETDYFMNYVATLPRGAAPLAQKVGQEYNDRIVAAIKNNAFQLIVQGDYYEPLMPLEQMELYYRKVLTLHYVVYYHPYADPRQYGRNPVTIDFWVRADLAPNFYRLTGLDPSKVP